jgi:hypothetical protein
MTAGEWRDRSAPDLGPGDLGCHSSAPGRRRVPAVAGWRDRSDRRPDVSLQRTVRGHLHGDCRIIPGPGIGSEQPRITDERILNAQD